MKRDTKIVRKDLEKMGFNQKGNFADCIIFGRNKERVFWNPQTKVIDFVYTA